MTDERREEQDPSLGEQVKAVRDDFAPSKLNDRLEEVLEERPKARRLLDFSIVGKALLAAVVVALVLALLVSPKIAAIALVVIFVGGWLLGAQLSYDQRRETKDARAEDGDGDGADDGGEEDDAPARQAESRRAEPDDEEYEGDRGEAEADQEQEGKASGNGDDPSRKQPAEH